MHLAQDIDLTHGVLGGLLIGASSTVLYYVTGRTTGISGIVEGVIVNQVGDAKGWTITYVAGLMSAGALLGQHVVSGAFGDAPHALALTPEAVGLAAFLTGFGTRMGGGCTSGHGICGLPRRSLRSLVAVCTFMGTGALAAYVSRQTDLSRYVVAAATTAAAAAAAAAAPAAPTPGGFLLYLMPTFSTLVAVATVFNKNFAPHTWLFGGKDAGKNPSKNAAVGSPVAEHLVTFGCAFAMGAGLIISGMTNPSRVIGFLDFTRPEGWDPTLMGVMGGGVLLNLLTFHALHAADTTTALAPQGKSLRMRDVLKMGLVPSNMAVDWRLVTGAGLFGLGWGLGGACPGPVLVSLGGSVKFAGLFVPYMVAGMAVQEAFTRAMT